MIRKQVDGVVPWTQTRQSNGFIEALSGLFQAAKRKVARLHPFHNHAYRALSDRRQARLHSDQSACRLSHSFCIRTEFLEPCRQFMPVIADVSAFVV